MASIKSPINDEILKYITVLFPFIDLPFGILCVVLSENWILTLCMLPFFHINATLMFLLADRMKSNNPGAYVFVLNGLFYMFFQFYSGPASPGWGMLINVTIGASFMFNKPIVGQFLMLCMGIITGAFYYFIGASWEYAVLISLVLIAITILFSRTYSYLNIQQLKIQTKNQEIETKNKDITDSINYSKKIQLAVLPNLEYIQRNVPLFFILYQPKDIVSGDFYWFHELNDDEYILVCADCTGHGVPGALMTVIGTNLLNQIIIENKIHEPSRILQTLDDKIITTLKQEKERTLIVQDGMDLGLIKVNKKTKKFIYCGAKRSAFFVRENQSQEFKGSKFSIGGLRSGTKIFEEHEFTFLPDDMIYLYTDGYVDQFGGVKAKKYSSKRLKENLVNIHHETMMDQKNILEANVTSWMGNLEQIDDICLIGIRF